jgi:hypothetical protein
MNEVFSMNTFFMGDKFAEYNFSLHGLEALVPQKTPSLNFSNVGAYISLITMRISEFIKFLNTAPKHYYPFFTTLLLLSLVFSKARHKTLLISLIVLNFIVTILFLTPYYALLRYQESIFPLVMILIASCFVHIREWAYNKMAVGRYALLLVMLLYAGYFAFRHYDFFKFIASRGENSRMVLIKDAAHSSRLITERIGCGYKIAALDPIQYNVIHGSGNTPVYFFDGWQLQAIEDYIKTRKLRYFIGKDENIAILDAKGVPVRVICPILEASGTATRLLLCEFSQ